MRKALINLQTPSHEEFAKYAGALKTLDAILGISSTVLLIVYAIQTKRGIIGNTALAWSGVFFVGNMTLSQFTLRMKNPFWLEVFRVLFIGGVSCFFAYTNGPALYFWPLYLIMSLGSSVDFFLITRRAIYPYTQLAFWLGNLTLANALHKSGGIPWEIFPIFAAAITTTTVSLIQVIGFLIASMRRELEIGTQMMQSSKMSSLGEMAGGIAHEINNPLASIKSVSSQIQELLEDDDFEKPTLLKMAATIERTTDRIAKIVQGLRTFSRDGSKDEFKPVQVTRLLAETLGLCSERFRNHGITLRCAPVAENITFEGREVEISQVLINLLNNAYDAVNGAENGWVEVSARENATDIEIRVSDSGPPIPVAVRTKIFQPFFTTKEIGKGTGLGLSISSGLVQAHQGTLSLDPSSINTCFIVRIPKRQRDAAGPSMVAV